MSYRSRILKVLILSTFSSLFFSCKKKSDTEVPHQPILGFSQIGAESEWRIRNTESILNAAAENNVQILYENAQQKQENQLQAIHSFIVYQVDVIAFVPIVETGWDNVLKEAKEAGIPVIVVDRKIITKEPDLYAGYIGEDTREEGRNAARFLLKKFTDNKKTLNILEISGTENSSAAYERAGGFREIMDNHPEFKIIHTENGDFLRSKGYEIGSKIIAYNNNLSIGSNPIDIVFSQNDAMTLGFLDSLSENNLDASNYTIISFDGEKKAIQGILDKKISCVVECNPDLGPSLIQLVQMLNKGHQIPPVTFVQESVYSEFNTPEELQDKGF